MKVVWVTVKTDLVGSGDGVDSKVASVRYRALIPAAGLRARGHHALVVGHDAASRDQVRGEIADADVVVFRRDYDAPEGIEQLLAETAAAGKKTYSTCRTTVCTAGSGRTCGAWSNWRAAWSPCRMRCAGKSPTSSANRPVSSAIPTKARGASRVSRRARA